MPGAACHDGRVRPADIDFRRELRRGDNFHVVYEALTADGEPITWNQASGRVLAEEFINNGRTYSAVWYQDEHSKGGYYGFDGQSKRRAFLASCVWAEWAWRRPISTWPPEPTTSAGTMTGSNT